MTAQRDDALWRTAMDYVLALHDDRGTALRKSMLRAQAEGWCARDPRHAALFAEAERVWALSGSLPARHRHRWPAATDSAPLLTRRRLIAAGGMALAAGLAGLTIAPQAMHWLHGDSITGTAEVRRLDLPDGSRITLGPRSALRAASSDRPGLQLLQGFAFFELRASTEPFTVQAGLLQAATPDANFELRHGDGDAFIAVERGTVDLTHAAMTGLDGKRLQAGDWLALQETQVDSGTSDPHRAGQWRDGILTVETRPVRVVAAEIARWHRGRVVVLDDALGNRPVSGVFDLTQPEAALRAMLQPFGGRVRTVTPWLALLDVG